jgi:hypothetical protein
MKTKVIIENGETTIILTPENEFENDVIEKVYNRKVDYNIHSNFSAEISYGTYHKHKIELSIKNIRP